MMSMRSLRERGRALVSFACQVSEYLVQAYRDHRRLHISHTMKNTSSTSTAPHYDITTPLDWAQSSPKASIHSTSWTTLQMTTWTVC
jgi:hypothetical protein